MELYIFVFFSFVLGNPELILLVKGHLQSLKQEFENMAIEETMSKQDASAVIGEVFVRKAVAGICLKACEESGNQGVTSQYSDVIQTLLQSSEYEVRLAVLEFINSHLPADNSLDCEVELHEDALHSRAGSWMFGELDSQFKSQLFTMAMNVEHHADCLVKVFDYILFIFYSPSVHLFYLFCDYKSYSNPFHPLQSSV